MSTWAPDSCWVDSLGLFTSTVCHFGFVVVRFSLWIEKKSKYIFQHLPYYLMVTISSFKEFSSHLHFFLLSLNCCSLTFLRYMWNVITITASVPHTSTLTHPKGISSKSYQSEANPTEHYYHQHALSCGTLLLIYTQKQCTGYASNRWLYQLWCTFRCSKTSNIQMS